MTAIVENLTPRYKSKTEEAYALVGAILVMEEFAYDVVLTMNEPMTFRIPGGKYTPDFMHILESGKIVFVEVKKNKHLKSYRDSRAKLRAAAEVFPFFHWVMSLDLVLEVLR